MTMTSSQFGLDDMEALLWGPSSPMADPMGSLFFHPDQEQHGGNSFEGATSPASPLTSSLSSSSSPPPFYTPPPSPPADLFRGDKPGSEMDLLSISWSDHPAQLRSHTVSDESKGKIIYFISEQHGYCEYFTASFFSITYRKPTWGPRLDG